MGPHTAGWPFLKNCSGFSRKFEHLQETIPNDVVLPPPLTPTTMITAGFLIMMHSSETLAQKIWNPERHEMLPVSQLKFSLARFAGQQIKNTFLQCILKIRRKGSLLPLIHPPERILMH